MLQNQEFKITNHMMAPLELRMANFFIDYFIIRIVATFIALVLDVVFFRNSLFSIGDWIESLTLGENYLAGMVLLFFYYTLTETLLQRSLAKYITKTIVVMEDGSQPNFLTILYRSANRMIPFEFMTFLQNGSRGWHDKHSETYVVRKRRFDEKQHQFYTDNL